jgi:hypothetical protein
VIGAGLISLCRHHRAPPSLRLSIAAPPLHLAAPQPQPQGDVSLPRRSHSHRETCRCLILCCCLILCRCLVLCCCLVAPLHVVLCEFNEPHSQSFGVGTQVCSECVSILILSSIFKHCTNLKNSLAGGASVIGNCATQVNLWG